MASLERKPTLSSMPMGKTQAYYDPPTEDRPCCITYLLTVRFPLCSSANDSSSAALGNCMDIYSKSDSTAMLLALRLATRPAWRQTDSASSLLESMLALPEGWDLRGDVLHRRFQSYPMAGKRLGCNTIGVKSSVPSDSENSNSKRFCSQHISSWTIVAVNNLRKPSDQAFHFAIVHKACP